MCRLKFHIIILTIIVLILIVSLPFLEKNYRPAAAATAGISLTGSVQTDFPNSITFKIKAQSDSKITQLRLHYTVDHQNFASVISESWAQFTPATTVNTQWFWDMRKSSLPVSSAVEYWWSAVDAAGITSETEHATISFDDNRYKWQSIIESPVTIYWYKGNLAFAEALMSAAQEGLQRIKNNTGATPEGNVRIYIYASAADLQGAQLFAQEWTGGVSFSGFNIIAIGVAPNQLSFGERAVPHELTHWIVGQITFNNYGAGLPTWLEEGLATYGEGTLSPDYQTALDYAKENNRLLSVRSLSSPFSAVPEVAYISYGESNSLVTFLIEKYGKDKMRQLLETFHQGSTYDAALKSVYGFDQDGLDTLWRQSPGIK